MKTLKVKVIGQKYKPEDLEVKVNEFLFSIQSEQIYQINYMQSGRSEAGTIYTAVITYYEL